MKLYLSPGTCAQSCHIVLREAGLAFTPVFVDLKTHHTADGDDYYAVNPKGYVPVLEFDTGERLTEAPAVLQYIADLAPTKNLVPAAGTLGRYRVQEWLNFTSSEIHKAYGALFSDQASDADKAKAKARVTKRLAYVERTASTW
jgi:glutathione S-transferase